MKFSFTNIATAASIAASTTFVDAGHPASNAQDALHPHRRAYSPNTSAHRYTLDFGSTTTLDVIAILNPNFQTVTVQGNGTDAWGAPSYTSGALTIGLAGNDRLQHGLRPTVFAQRYLSLSIPSQATWDGASIFKLGPIWAGTLTTPTSPHLRMDPEEDKVESYKDLTTPDGRRIQRVILGDPTWQVSGRRIAYGNTMAEHNAALAVWREIDRLWSLAAGQAALVLWRDAYPAETYVMRKTTSRWRNGTRSGLSESDLITYEVTAG